MRVLAIIANLIALLLFFMAIKKYGLSNDEGLYTEIAVLVAILLSLVALIYKTEIDDLLDLYIERKKLEQSRKIDELKK